MGLVDRRSGRRILLVTCATLLVTLWHSRLVLVKLPDYMAVSMDDAFVGNDDDDNYDKNETAATEPQWQAHRQEQKPGQQNDNPRKNGLRRQQGEAARTGEASRLHKNNDASEQKRPPSKPTFETWKPNSNFTSSSSSNSQQQQARPGPYMAACLLVMDDNHQLPEWIAYHYYMLPLRHLVLLVDPRSETWPDQIVERWQAHMRIDVILDKDVPRPRVKRNFTTELEVVTAQHRRRQGHFYQYCANYLRVYYGGDHNNRTGPDTSDSPAVWTTFHDVDEFIYLDPVECFFVPRGNGCRQRMSKPGSILKLLQDLPHLTMPNETETLGFNDTTTTTNTKKAKRKHAQKRQRLESLQHHLRLGCYFVPRTYFGATPEPYERVRKQVPSFLNGSDFATLSWLHRTAHSDGQHNGPGKSIVNVLTNGRTPVRHRLDFNAAAVHRILNQCLKDERFGNPLRIRHYLGSWESFTARRHDARVGYERSREMYDYRVASFRHETDDVVRSWLSGFVELLKDDVALIQHLLRDATQFPQPPAHRNRSLYSMTPSQLHYEMYHGPRRHLARWLRTEFNVTKLPNGTIVAKRNDPDTPYPFYLD